MRGSSCGWLVGCIFALACASAAAEPAGLREPDRLQFEGVAQVSERDIRDALKFDFDVALAAHPDVPVKGYCRAVESSTLLGYLNSGFRDAQITASYDEQRAGIVVRVNEGRRRLCGAVHVTGAQAADGNLLVQAVTQSATKQPALWVPDDPAPFDEPTRLDIHNRLKDAFAAQGFFRPSFVVRMSAEAADQPATLEIKIDQEGPCAEVGAITVGGNQRDSDAEILKYLDLCPGQRYDSGLATRLQTRLEKSGRFLGATIERASGVRVFDRGKEIVDLRIEVRDLESASPLSRDLSSEEKTVLAFCDWLARWSRGDTEYDFVVDLSLGIDELRSACSEMDMPMPLPEESLVKRVEFRLVSAPRRGQTLRVRLLDAGNQALLDDTAIFYPDRLVFGSIVRKARLQLPHPNAGQLTLNIEARGREATEDDDRPFNVMFGTTWSSTTRPERAGLVKANVSPSAALGLFRRDQGVTFEREGDTLRRGSEDAVTSIDLSSGRVLEFVLRFPDADNEAITNRLTLRTEAGAFARETAEIENCLASARSYAPDGLKSAVAFVLDDLLFVMRRLESSPDKIAAWQAVRKILDRWSMPALDELRLGGITSATDDKRQRAEYNLPRATWSFTDRAVTHSRSQQFGAAVCLRSYATLVSQDNWLWATGRDYLLSQGAAEPGLASLKRQAAMSDLGPLHALALTATGIHSVVTTAAKNGRRNVTLEAFRRDLAPLLSDESWAGKWLLSLTEATRSLDEAELRSLAGFIDDEEPLVREMVASFLALLKEEPDKPAADALLRVVGVAWNLYLGEALATALERAAPAEDEDAAKNAPLARQLNTTDDSTEKR